jgi:antitoxin (DNA-binding transcriptional repressor) of toxin-antitoxin stability system
MPVYTVHEAETQLPKLMERAERGEEVIIARGDKPVVKITALEGRRKSKRQPGTLKGSIHIHESFFEPMTDEEIREIEEGHPGDPLRLPLGGRADEASS